MKFEGLGEKRVTGGKRAPEKKMPCQAAILAPGRQSLDERKERGGPLKTNSSFREKCRRETNTTKTRAQ